MVDQRGRDDPPIFYIDTQLAGYKYHALLTEPVAFSWTQLLDLAKDHQVKKVDGEFSVIRPRGLYGFQTVEERDKFCRKCNGLSEQIEYKIAYPVTVPNLYMDQPMVTSIRYQG